MSMWRQAVSYLGLGPDEDYDEFDVQERRAPEPPQARPAQRVRPSGPPPAQSRRAVAPPQSEYGVDDGDPDSVVRMMPGSSQGSRPSRDGARSTVRQIAPTQPPSKPQKVTPSGFNDAQEIADIFKRRQPVIVNLEDVDRELRRRLIDFSSGVCYGLGGSMERIAGNVYLLTPADVEVAQDDRRRRPDDD